MARPLNPGETNPPLGLVGTNWPLPEGAALYWRTNQATYGIVLKSRDNFLTAPDQVAKAVLVKWEDGTEDWILFDLLEKNYFSVPDGG